MTDLTIPDSIVGLGSLKNQAMGYCPALKNINIGESHPDFKLVDGVVYYKSGSTLVWYPCGRTESRYTVPSGTYAISMFAFNGCKNLTEVILPDECESIGSNAFRGCTSLETITLPAAIKDIQDSTFMACTSLKSLVILGNILTVGVLCFIQCPALTDVYFAGSEEDWEKIDFRSDNDILINANIHYNYTPEN